MRNRLIFIGLILLLGLAAFFVVRLQSKVKKLNYELASVKTQHEIAAQQGQQLELKNKADELFIAGHHEQALALYKKLPQTNKNDLAELRQAQIEHLLAKQVTPLVSPEPDPELQANLLELINWQSDANKEHARLKSAIDSLLRANLNLNFSLNKLGHELTEARHAKGELQFKSGKNIEVFYFGEITNGKATGTGTGIWKTGSIYKGEWQENQRHGKGHFVWADGESYEGEFAHDKRHGNGTYFWKNGEKYVGQWADDRRSGQGVVYDSKGTVKAEGMWSEDKLVSNQKINGSARNVTLP